MRQHRPVMLAEVLDLLAIKTGFVVIDGTVGEGGHAKAMLRDAGPEGWLIAFDWDESMLRTAEANLASVEGRKTFVCADYRDIPAWLSEAGNIRANAVLLDMGVSMRHLEDELRGFSFRFDAPLDMRMNTSTKETAAAWLGRASEQQIARALREYGGERHAGAIARAIVRRRNKGKLRSTNDLVESVLEAVPPRLREKRIHPATRTFQAVRIAVNRELEGLEEALQDIAGCLAEGGRFATLAYHSGEDGAVKHAFKSLAQSGGYKILTKRPLRPSTAEVRENPSSRSARLRAIERFMEDRK